MARFANLRVINLAGNPVCKNPDYKSYALARIKNLKYLDYRLVDQKSVDIAREKYIDVLIAIEQTEKELSERAEVEAQLLEKENQLKVTSTSESFQEDICIYYYVETSFDKRE